MNVTRSIAVLLLGVSLSACAPGDSDAERTAVVTPVDQIIERGPIRMAVHADRDRLEVGEKLTLTIDVTAPTGVAITMPEIEDPVGPFTLRASQRPPDVPEGDQRRWRHTYVLDTFEPGDPMVPAFMMVFDDARAVATGGDAVRGELISDPFPILVLSVLAADATDADYHDIKGGVDVEIAGTPPWAWALGAMTLLVALAFALWIRRRRRRVEAEAVEVVIAADVWAFGKLERLAEDGLGPGGLIERREHHEFYFRLSDIVRQYIERRFGLMAPEQTTDEFLHEAGRSAVLAADDRTLLADFLRTADMVKFARHEPGPAEPLAAFDAARGFVERTRPRLRSRETSTREVAA